MRGCGGGIIAAGLDGRIYFAGPDGGFRAVTVGAADPLRLPPPRPATAGETVAVAAGNALYLFR